MAKKKSERILITSPNEIAYLVQAGFEVLGVKKGKGAFFKNNKKLRQARDWSTILNTFRISALGAYNKRDV